MSFVGGEGGEEDGDGDTGLVSLFCFPRTERELKAKRGGVLGREESERGPAFCILFFSFLFFFSFFSFFFSLFLFLCPVVFYETKRNEAK